MINELTFRVEFLTSFFCPVLGVLTSEIKKRSFPDGKPRKCQTKLPLSVLNAVNRIYSRC